MLYQEKNKPLDEPQKARAHLKINQSWQTTSQIQHLPKNRSKSEAIFQTERLPAEISFFELICLDNF